ncbi:unnamed protein product [Cylindrotheca closterium]|uniref:Uncharacterized protein n=1 Tax=Cylindrotheca closterium TaxID=2856 RepID=A0AAD2CNA8_9STRA|nr:unnamed protein product [Cylindrotheca closterium]
MDIDESSLHTTSQTPPQVYFIYFGQAKEDIPRNITHVTIDPSVSKIHDYAFQDCHLLASVQFHDHLQEIGDSAFQRCRSLTLAAGGRGGLIPSTVKVIGQLAFSECSRLQDNLVLPHGLRSIRFLSFAWCESLTQISIPKTVENIDMEAMIGCSALLEVQLEKGLLSIGSHAFSNCVSLTTMTLPSSLTTLGEGAFNYSLALTEIKLSQALQAIEHNTFSWCRSLLEISIPNSVQTLGNGAFFNCTSLRDAFLCEGLISIQRRAFHTCTSLRKVHVPSTVSFIGDDAFYKCQSLTDVRLPQYLASIGDKVFWNCAALRSIEIPETVGRIGDEAFFFCTSLVDVSFPVGVRTIGTRAFGNCEALSAISLPSSLTMIAPRAFAMCSSLLCVEFPADGMERVTIGEFCFDGCNSLVTLSMPPSSVWESTSLMTCAALMDLRFGLESDLLQKQMEQKLQSLRGRFDNLPVHLVCYHSSRTTVQDVERVLDGIGNIFDDSEQHYDNWKDSYGLTPFHILATSVKPSVEMLSCLLDHCPDNTVQCLTPTDNQGLTMMDYLLLHTSDAVFPLIQVVLNRLLVHEMSKWGLERWSMEVSFCVNVDSNSAGSHDNETKLANVKRVLVLLGYYLRVEMTSLAELAVWKKNIQEVSSSSSSSSQLELLHQSDDDDDDDDDDEVVEEHRSSCRWQSGVEVVLQNVIGFLWEKNQEEPRATCPETAVSIYPLLSLQKMEDAMAGMQ